VINEMLASEQDWRKRQVTTARPVWCSPARITGFFGSISRSCPPAAKRRVLRSPLD